MIKKQIPNCVTLLNLLSGVMSIICSFHGAKPLWGLCGWEWGAIFIGIGAVADFLDGFCARLLKAYSDVGKELDSLCDLVTFGVAPALLVFNLFEEMPQVEPWMKWCILLVPAMAALRLARFNVDTRQTVGFIGMPVPANAIFWIGFAGLAADNASFLLLPWIFLPVLMVEAWLMISPLRMLSLKFQNYSFTGSNIWRYSLVLVATLSLFCMGTGGLLWLIVYYVFASCVAGRQH